MSAKRLVDIKPTKRICRKLFGDVDHDVIKQDLIKENKENIKQKSYLWNFDFNKCIPIINKDSTIVWLPLKTENFEDNGQLIVSSKSLNEKTTKNINENYSSTNIGLPSNGTQESLETLATLTVENQKHSNIENVVITSSKITEPDDQKLNSSIKADDKNECKIIKIVNALPPRPKCDPVEISKVKAKHHCVRRIDVTQGRRKRSYQPKIDGKESQLAHILTLPFSFCRKQHGYECICYYC